MNSRQLFSSSVRASIIAGLLLPSFALAATVNGILNVQAVVGSGCQVNASNVNAGAVNYGTLNFGAIYALGSQHIDSETTGTNQGSVTVECSIGTAYNITFGEGQNYQSSTRAMSSGNSVLLNYELYQDSARQQAWPINAVSFTAASTTPLTHHVYGRIPGGQNGIVAGTYTDQVAVIVNW